MTDKLLPHHHRDDAEAEKLKEMLDNTEQFQTAADVFKMLGDQSRLRIFWLLCHCEECVINISALVDMTSPAVSHHLRQLKDRGLIESRREGKEVYYRAADTEESRQLHLALEQIMAITCPESEQAHGEEEQLSDACRNRYQEEQIETIRRIHRELIENLDRRITIEELSKKYLMNTSTLKALFKEVYGTSIAAHMKEHRMEKAADLLRETNDAVADIARAVGYESQSKFTAAFREEYKRSPTEYRKEKREEKKTDD